MAISQGPQIVDSEDVVGMRVSVEHGIELRNVFAERLFAKVGRGVDQNVVFVVTD